MGIGQRSHLHGLSFRRGRARRCRHLFYGSLRTRVQEFNKTTKRMARSMPTGANPHPLAGPDHTIKPALSKEGCHPDEVAAATQEGPAFPNSPNWLTNVSSSDSRSDV